MTDLGDAAIVVRNVGVRYDLRLHRNRTLLQTVNELLRGSTEKTTFWALSDVSFTVEPGDVLGVIGRNGSGKSTLLLAVSGILRPDTGTIRTFGRTSSLLTLGAGFQPELTGRQNVYLNGAFLGYGRAKMDRLMEEIVEFSGLGAFIDAPIRQYSAGMRARLGFSIAAHIEPDILLLDEVLGVGDADFKEKSKEKMGELIEHANVIVMASHDMSFVKEICTKVLWLEEGRVAAIGSPDEAVERYGESVRGDGAAVRAVSESQLRR